MKAIIHFKTDKSTFAARREDQKYFVFAAPKNIELNIGDSIEGDLDAPEGLTELTTTKTNQTFRANVEDNRCEGTIATLFLTQLKSPTQLQMLNSKGIIEVMKL
jgi:hypothetical protein